MMLQFILARIGSRCLSYLTTSARRPICLVGCYIKAIWFISATIFTFTGKTLCQKKFKADAQHSPTFTPRMWEALWRVRKDLKIYQNCAPKMESTSIVYWLRVTTKDTNDDSHDQNIIQNWSTLLEWNQWRVPNIN